MQVNTTAGIEFIGRVIAKTFPQVVVYYEHGGTKAEKYGFFINQDGTVVSKGNFESLKKLHEALPKDQILVGISNLFCYGIRDYRIRYETEGWHWRLITHTIRVGELRQGHIALEPSIQEWSRCIGYYLRAIAAKEGDPDFKVISYDTPQNFLAFLRYKQTALQLHLQPANGIPGNPIQVVNCRDIDVLNGK